MMLSGASTTSRCPPSTLVARGSKKCCHAVPAGKYTERFVAPRTVTGATSRSGPSMYLHSRVRRHRNARHARHASRRKHASTQVCIHELMRSWVHAHDGTGATTTPTITRLLLLLRCARWTYSFALLFFLVVDTRNITTANNTNSDDGGGGGGDDDDEDDDDDADNDDHNGNGKDDDNGNNLARCRTHASTHTTHARRHSLVVGAGVGGGGVLRELERQRAHGGHAPRCDVGHQLRDVRPQRRAHANVLLEQRLRVVAVV
jgi:hypothetical protein